jgi:hypothetical protein
MDCLTVKMKALQSFEASRTVSPKHSATSYKT